MSQSHFEGTVHWQITLQNVCPVIQNEMAKKSYIGYIEDVKPGANKVSKEDKEKVLKKIRKLLIGGASTPEIRRKIIVDDGFDDVSEFTVGLWITRERKKMGLAKPPSKRVTLEESKKINQLITDMAHEQKSNDEIKLALIQKNLFLLTEVSMHRRIIDIQFKVRNGN